MPRVYIGLGSNLGEREAMIRAALGRLGSTEDIRVHRVSSLRETDPVGYEDQPRFLNGVAEVETDLSPRALLDRILQVERDLGRNRDGPRFGPRTIDLDLLLYGNDVVDEPGLQIPHPRMTERAFVLEPLLELDSELEIPGAGLVRDLAAGLH